MKSSGLKLWQITWITLVFLFTLSQLPSSAAEQPPTTRVGVRLIKQERKMSTHPPRILILDDPERWRMREGEAWTGENPLEYYFTLEAEGKAEPPRVELQWDKIRIERILGADADLKRGTENGLLRFRMGKGLAPTKVLSSITVGQSIHMAIFHNWEVRRAGNYRSGVWPQREIDAHLNFLFAAREAAKAMGLEAENPGFRGDIRLYGFESNFPNGHEDYPPHFHIMLGWPDWDGTQVTHFRLDENGRITHNDFFVVGQERETERRYNRGERCDLQDATGKIGFSLTILDDGSGVEWSVPTASHIYRLRSDDSTKSVEVLRKPIQTNDDPDAKWEFVCRTSVNDSADRGVMQITIESANAQSANEVIRYDRDTGQVLSKEK